MKGNQNKWKFCTIFGPYEEFELWALNYYFIQLHIQYPFISRRVMNNDFSDVSFITQKQIFFIQDENKV